MIAVFVIEDILCQMCLLVSYEVISVIRAIKTMFSNRFFVYFFAAILIFVLFLLAEVVLLFC